MKLFEWVLFFIVYAIIFTVLPFSGLFVIKHYENIGLPLSIIFLGFVTIGTLLLMHLTIPKGVDNNV